MSSSNVIGREHREGEGEGEDGLFLDDDADDKNEEYMRRQRQKYRGFDMEENDRMQRGVEDRSFKSDAILCCPACFATVCIDCQRHEFQKHRYRAMFVQNCTVRSDLFISTVEFDGEEDDADADADGAAGQMKGQLHPVECSECGTTIGVYDHHQVYHFIDVLPSEA
eukprot:ANDGO_02173.mRNA.1 hypothetical protein